MSELTSLSDVSLYLDSNVFIYACEGDTGSPRDSASLIVRRVFTGDKRLAAASARIPVIILDQLSLSQ